MNAGNPSDPTNQQGTGIDQVHVGDALQAEGDLAGAFKVYKESLVVNERAVMSDPLNTRWQYDRVLLFRKMGIVQLALGDRPGSLSSFQESLATNRRLTNAYPSDVLWKAELSTSLVYAGDVLMEQRKLNDALPSYRESLAIVAQLAENDPTNLNWQQQLSLSQERVGDALREQDDLAGAMQAYNADLAILERLLTANPSKEEWQYDLGICCERIGNIFEKQGDFKKSLLFFRRRHEIIERLASAHPTNSFYQRDLSTSHRRLGSALLEHGDLVGAMDYYNRSLVIIEQMANDIPSNAEWQRDLFMSCWNLSLVAERLNEHDVKKWQNKAYEVLNGMKQSGLQFSKEEEISLRFLEQKCPHLSGGLKRRKLPVQQDHSQASLKADRQIRVFVSSTFRDMHEERDYLVKFVFPQLRKLCEERAVTWTEVDLRWGVTDEEKAEGKVLPIVMAEIERCQPFFIGLLGDYYGQIYRDNIPADLTERFPWLKNNGDKSLTELEILHGVLNNKELSEHAVFYFRDPAYAKGKNEAEKADFVSIDDTSRTKLEDLKQRIRDAHKNHKLKFAPRENYANPQALGEQVLADFTELIEKLYAKEHVPDPLDQEATHHETYAHTRRLAFVGREDILRKVNQHISTSSNYLILTGESGCGKSALLAEWVERWRRAYPDDLIIQHYIGNTPDSADWRAVVRRILGELKRAFAIADDIPNEPGALRIALSDWIVKAVGSRVIILVLDGLNQIVDDSAGRQLGWLPVIFPTNFGVLVSSTSGKILDSLRDRSWPEINVPLLQQADIAPAARAYFKMFAKTPPPDVLAKLELTPAAYNALYLRAVLDELRQFGVHEKLQAKAADYLTARNPKELYERILTRWEQDFGEDLVRQSFSLIWIARRGLSESELADLLGANGQPLPRAMWTPLYLAAESSLAYGAGLLTFCHDYLRNAVHERFFPLPEREKEFHHRIVTYFLPKEITGRKVDELPWHLLALHDWQQLATVLSDASFLPVAWLYQRFDLTGYWAAVEASSPLRAETFFNCAETSPEITVETAQIQAEILATLGHLTLACARLQWMLEQWHEKENLLHRIRALTLLAKWNLQANRLIAARDAAKELERVAQEATELHIVVEALEIQAQVVRKATKRGDVRAHRGLTEDARGFEDRAIKLCRRAGLRTELARLLGCRVTESEVQVDFDSMFFSAASAASLLSTIAGSIDSRRALVEKHQSVYERDLNEFEGLCKEIGDAKGLLLAMQTRCRGMNDGPKRIDLLQKQMQLAEQIGDAKCIGELIGKLAEHLPPKARLSELEKQEVLWRKIGYRPGLAKNLLDQAGILFDSVGDRVQADAKCKEAFTLKDALPNRRSRIFAQMRRVQIQFNLTEARQHKIALLALVCIGTVCGLIGWIIWRLVENATLLLKLPLRLCSILFFLLTLLPIVGIISEGLDKIRAFFRPAEEKSKSDKRVHKAPADQHKTTLSRTVTPQITHGKNIQSSQSPPASATNLARRSKSGGNDDEKLEATVGVFILGLLRFWNVFGQRIRWQRRMIRKFGFERWAWQFIGFGIVGGSAWLLYHYTSATTGAWWQRTLLVPFHLAAVLLLLQTAGVLLKNLVGATGLVDRLRITSSQPGLGLSSLFYYEVFLGLAFLPLRLRRLFTRRH